MKIYKMLVSIICIYMNSLKACTSTVMPKPVNCKYCKILYPNQKVCRNWNKWMIVACVSRFCPPTAQTKAQAPPFSCWHKNSAQALFGCIYNPHVFDAPAALYAAIRHELSACVLIYDGWSRPHLGSKRSWFVYILVIFWCCLEAFTRCKSN